MSNTRIGSIYLFFLMSQAFGQGQTHIEKPSTSTQKHKHRRRAFYVPAAAVEANTSGESFYGEVV